MKLSKKLNWAIFKKGLIGEEDQWPSVSEILFVFGEFDLKKAKHSHHQENLASQRVAQKAGFLGTYRQFKGRDQCTRKMRDYIEFRYERGDF